MLKPRIHCRGRSRGLIGRALTRVLTGAEEGEIAQLASAGQERSDVDSRGNADASGPGTKASAPSICSRRLLGQMASSCQHASAPGGHRLAFRAFGSAPCGGMSGSGAERLRPGEREDGGELGGNSVSADGSSEEGTAMQSASIGGEERGGGGSCEAGGGGIPPPLLPPAAGIKKYLPDSIFSKPWLQPVFEKKLEELLHAWEIEDLESKELFARALVHEQAYNLSLTRGLYSPAVFTPPSYIETVRHWMAAHYTVRGRLELLGDSILSWTVISTLANSDDDTLAAGDITALKSEMVSNRALASFAEQNNIKELVTAHPWFSFPVGQGVKVALHNESANAVERLVGAIYVEKGLEAAIRVVKAKILPWMFQFVERSYGKGQMKHPVSMLEELCRKALKTNPEYTYDQEPYAAKHTVTVTVNGTLVATGHGGSRQLAKRNAAQAALQHISLSSHLGPLEVSNV